MITIFIAISALFLGSTVATLKETWSPDLNFAIEDGGYEDTLTFISGVSYALDAADRALKSSGLRNFFCFDGERVDSRLLVDILNEKARGSISAEEAIFVILRGLVKRFPCT